MRELAWVGNRRRREHELRLGAVHAREPAKAAEDIADVRPEHAAVHVRLVHDDVPEVVQHVRPQVVPRKDPDVEHVGVREHEVRPLARLPALLARRVAVVDRRAHPRHRERGERACLILREGLRRIQVERPVLRVRRERVQHRQVERERLPRRRSRRDDDVLAAAGRLPRPRLVLVQLDDSPAPERLPDRLVQPLRERLRASPACRLRPEIRDLFAGEKVVPDGNRHTGHANVRAPGCRGSG